MPSGSYLQVNVRCPFYQHDDGCRRITCEGLIEHNNLTLNYRKKRDFETQMKVFCCGRYEKCEICRMLMGKYED